MELVIWKTDLTGNRLLLLEVCLFQQRKRRRRSGCIGESERLRRCILLQSRIVRLCVCVEGVLWLVMEWLWMVVMGWLWMVMGWLWMQIKEIYHNR